jgi:hypothetical protein
MTSWLESDPCILTTTLILSVQVNTPAAPTAKTLLFLQWQSVLNQTSEIIKLSSQNSAKAAFVLYSCLSLSTSQMLLAGTREDADLAAFC